MNNIRVLMDPEQRQKFLDKLLEIDGLGRVEENPDAAYCFISLTQTPDELKSILRARQKTLIDNVLFRSGITGYDPEKAPFSPDRDLTTLPGFVYSIDSGKIAGARYFVGHNLLPSTGQGIEMEKAKTLMRVPVVLTDRTIRISRMQPHRTIYLQYQKFDQQAAEFVSVFKFLSQYNPGIGFNGNTPALLGFEKNSGKVVDLEEEVYRIFPNLQYHYDGRVPIIRLRAENPELFYERVV